MNNLTAKITIATLVLTAVTASNANALPVITSNSPNFTNDYTGTIGVQYQGARNVKKSVAPHWVLNKQTHKYDPICAKGAKINPVTCLCDSIVNAGNNWTGFGQGSVRTGGNTAVFAGYNTDGQSVYGGVAARFDNLATTIGLDGGGVRGSVAYSIGQVSPFYLRANKLDNYGVEYRLNENISANVAYSSDSSYRFGVNFDLSGNVARPQAVVAEVAPAVPAAITSLPVVEITPEPIAEPMPMTPPVQPEQTPDAPYIRGRG